MRKIETIDLELRAAHEESGPEARLGDFDCVLALALVVPEGGRNGGMDASRHGIEITADFTRPTSLPRPSFPTSVARS